MPVITSASLGFGQPSKIGPLTLIGSNGSPLFLAVCGRPVDGAGFVGGGAGAFAAGGGLLSPSAATRLLASADRRLLCHVAQGVRRLRRPVDRLQRRLRQRFARRQRGRLLELGHRQLRRANLLIRRAPFWRRGLALRSRRLLAGRGTTSNRRQHQSENSGRKRPR